MGDLSPHFSSVEFRSKRDGSSSPIAPALLVVLERIRALDGRPLRIVSGYRSPADNRAAKGAVRSQHLYGRAADIPAGRATVRQAETAGAVGIGERGGWAVHVDVRPGPPARWRY